MQPASDNSDVDLFLIEIEEESKNVRASQESATADLTPDSSERRQTEEGLIRFAEFLKMRMKMGPRSRRGMALQRYQIQLDACPTSEEQEIKTLASYRRYA